jgi:predicted transposase/invertase (TIGR01784 family)
MDELLVVKPQLDVIFKKLFVENPDLLADFLSVALNMPLSDLKDIEILNPEIIPEDFGEKFARLDLIIKTPGGTKINVELQNYDEMNYKERSVFNCSKLFTRDLKSGQDYIKIAKTVCINILQFTLFPEAGAKCTVFPTIQETAEVVTDKWEIIYYQTTKLTDETLGDILNWLKFFTVKTEKELEIMENTDSRAVSKAAVIIREMNADDRAKELARMREKAWIHEQLVLGGTLEKGKNIGRVEGIEIGAILTAHQLLLAGIDRDTISKATGLSPEQFINPPAL